MKIIWIIALFVTLTHAGLFKRKPKRETFEDVITLQSEPSHKRSSIRVYPGQHIVVNFIASTYSKPLDDYTLPDAQLVLVPYHSPRVEVLNYVQSRVANTLKRIRWATRLRGRRQPKDKRLTRAHIRKQAILKKKRNLWTILMRPYRSVVLKKTKFLQLRRNHDMYRMRAGDIKLAKINFKQVVNYKFKDVDKYGARFIIKIPKAVEKYSGDIYEFGIKMLGAGFGGEHVSYGMAYETIRLQMGRERVKPADALKKAGYSLPPAWCNGVENFDREIKPYSILTGSTEAGMFVGISLQGLPNVDQLPTDAETRTVFYEDVDDHKSLRYTFTTILSLRDEGEVHVSFSQFRQTDHTYIFRLRSFYEPSKKRGRRYNYYHDYQLNLLRPLAMKSLYANGRGRIATEVKNGMLQIHFIDTTQLRQELID